MLIYFGLKNQRAKDLKIHPENEEKNQLTNNDRFGVRMRANPAATLHAPTPTFRIAVGYNSAV
jgi:hypothetical protein